MRRPSHFAQASLIVSMGSTLIGPPYRRVVLYRRSSQVADRSDTSLRAHYNQRWRPETAKTLTTTGGLELAQGGGSLTWAAIACRATSATYTQSDSRATSMGRGRDEHGTGHRSEPRNRARIRAAICR